jgi:hypothetical protein
MRNLWEKIKGEPIGSVSIALTCVLFLAQYFVDVGAARRAEVSSRAAEIRMQAMDFQTFMGAYVSAVLDNRDSAEARTQLTDNVMRQFSTVELSKTVYAPETETLARKYQESLINFSTTLQKPTDVLTMRPLWEAASDVLVSRDHFLAAIDDQS